MRLRHVVSCFLTHPADGTVLLGRRSEQVATYKGCWAAISGSVEGEGLLEAALREIAEETGLAAEQVEVISEGRPIRFVDWPLATAWVVHPFLLRCRAPEAVRRDWEHVQLRWTAPSDIAGLRTVPKLAEAYESAARGDVAAEDVFARVAEDRTHGAEELGIWTLEGLRAAALRETSAADWREAMTAACRRALELRPSMAPVRSAALEAFRLCREEPQDALSAGLAAAICHREEAPLAAAATAATMLPDGARVVTLSYSSTVLCTLRDAAEHLGTVLVAESRPACEGRETARLATSFGIPTELLTDAATAGALKDCDILLIGADAVCADGTVVNKTGTFALTCAARRLGVQTLCVATESKLLPAGHEPQVEEMPPEELGPPIPEVQTRNPYFEPIPPDLIDALIGPTGSLILESLAERADALSTLQEALKGA